MATKETITLYSPSGEKFETTDKAEANRLLVGGYGYTVKPPAKPAAKSEK